MSNSTTKSSVLFCLAFVFLFTNGYFMEAASDTKLYIVYLGERQHDDPSLTERTHHSLLTSVVGSKELATDLMVANYKHGFSGFAAKLTDSHVQQISELPEVVHITPNIMYELQTTRSWEYMGLPTPTPKNLLGKANQGEDIIIGVLDSGIWPESQSFSDEGIGPIPARWKGKCLPDSGDGSFDPSKHCNRKIIGAHYFMDGFLEQMAEDEKDKTRIRSINPNSARDIPGSHGTHVASIAAGNYVRNINYKGFIGGTARGGAPKARIALYKVCWLYDQKEKERCCTVDILKAMDQAIEDGVDVIQASLGTRPPIFPEVNNNPYVASYAIGTFHAMSKGIPVVIGGGNDGPDSQSVFNVEPWELTVGAIHHDRSYPTPITLGNNVTIIVQAFNPGIRTGFKGLYMHESGLCEALSSDPELMNQTHLLEGKIVVCFEGIQSDQTQANQPMRPPPVKLAGVIMAKRNNIMLKYTGSLPYIEVTYEVGTKILEYNQSTSDPIISIGPTKSVVDSGHPMVATFSCRGPNSHAPEILKPDIVAPGVHILGAGMPAREAWVLQSGTSMATPHVSGIVALLKKVHPEWSPAAIKSAIMTTAWNTNRYGFPIFEESTKKVAGHFDIGAGIVNPDAASDPGLVYDIQVSDYVHYLCARGYTNSSISKVLTNRPTSCPTQRPSLLNLNLPSITVPSLHDTTTIERTVTNVGHTNSVYKAVIEHPTGIIVSVKPTVLVFSSTIKTRSFEVTLSPIRPGIHSEGYIFGSLTWTDDDHKVRSPISVKL